MKYMNINHTTVSSIQLRLKFEAEGFDPGTSRFVWNVFTYDRTDVSLGQISIKVRSPSFRGDNEQLAIGAAIKEALDSCTLVHNDYGLSFECPEEHKAFIDYLKTPPNFFCHPTAKVSDQKSRF